MKFKYSNPLIAEVSPQKTDRPNIAWHYYIDDALLTPQFRSVQDSNGYNRASVKSI